MILKQVEQNEKGQWNVTAIPVSHHDVVSITRSPELTRTLTENKQIPISPGEEVLEVSLRNGNTITVFDNFTRLSKLANVNILHG